MPVWSNFNFLHNSQWITLLTQLCLVFNAFCANLQHLFPSNHYITFIFYFVTAQLFLLYYYYLHWSFALMVFHWILIDSKSPQVSRTLLSILAVLNNVVVWIVSTLPPTSKSFSPFSNPLVTVPKAPITIALLVTFMFHSFFNSLARSRYLSFFSHYFSFILWLAGTAKSTILKILFSLIIIKSSLLAEITWSFVRQSPIGVYACHFLGQGLDCAYTICWYDQI